MRIPSAAAFAVLTLAAVLAGCRTVAPTTEEARAIARQQQQEAQLARQQIDNIPPPSKTRYMAVRSLSLWENPYVTVQAGMVTLHVLAADANTSKLGVGGMLRPMGARRQELNVRISELPIALNAVPADSWPYGRVIAIEEAHNTPAGAEPQIRRNMEAVIRSLNDLGIVVYEWNDNGRG